MAEKTQEKKPKSYRNAFVRIFVTNHTQNGLVKYSKKDLLKLIKSWTCVQEYELILHDEENPHFHICFRFKSPVPKKNIISKIPYANIEGARNYKKCVQYLIHANDTDKVQYSKKEIVTNLPNLDKYFLLDGKDEVAELENILVKIEKGEIKQYNFTDFIDIKLYSKYKTKIKNAFEYRIHLLSQDKTRDINIIFLCGASGTGKTTWAKDCCIKLGKSYSISSSSNDPFQDYLGEDVLILDDLRDDSFSFSDLLKILDNNTKSTVKSRYRNKLFLGDTIFITSTVPLHQWYTYCEYEEKKQLHRRIKQLYNFTHDEIKMYYYDDDNEKYSVIHTIENNIIDRYKSKKVNNPITKLLKELEIKPMDTFGTQVEIDNCPFEKK